MYEEAKSFTIEAKTENLDKALSFLSDCLAEAVPEIGDRARMQITLAAEEIFVNISNYAYPKGEGRVELIFKKQEVSQNSKAEISLCFIDSGIPYNPISNAKPDPTELLTDENKIGGLGIFLVKNMVDDIYYSYENGRNHLTLNKLL